MKVLVITCSPNRKGLTAACGLEAEKGIRECGGESFSINLNENNIAHCNACNNGFGTCINKYICQVKDVFKDFRS